MHDMQLMKTLSKIHQTDSEPVTVADRILFWGKRDPKTPAFIFWSEDGTRELTRGDVLDLSSRFANRLVRCGVEPGDVVCISLPNCPERVVAEFGVQLAGAVSMNGQVLRADGEDLIASLIKAECRCIIVDPDQSKGAWELCKPRLDEYNVFEHHAHLKSKIISSIKTAVFTNNNLFDTLKQEDVYLYEKRKPTSRAMIFTTSGSTGYSKLVPNSSANILKMAHSLSLSLQLESGSTYLNISPLGWIGGYPFVFLAVGSTRMLVHENLKVIKKETLMWEIVKKGCISAALLTPQITISAPKRKNTDGKKIANILVGGQPIKRQHLEAMMDHAEAVTILYGSTEIGVITTLKIQLENVSQFQEFQAGYPFNGGMIEIVDENLKTLPFMSKGEILVKSPILSLKYLGSESEESFLPDGWFRTGDIGYLREDGCLFVEGRSADAIMHGAYILYPNWWEQKLDKCPGVKEAVIVPVPDKVLHHEICACIKLDDKADVQPSAEDIIKFCKQETLLDEGSSLNILPKYVLFFEDFPKTTSNKLHRQGLAAVASRRLCLSVTQ